MVVPGVAFALGLNALVVAGLLVAVVIAARRLETDEPAGRWAVEAAALARAVRETAGHDGPVDHDRLQREVLPLAARLRGHARAAPPAADPRAVRSLRELADDCYALGMEHTTRRAARTGVFVEEQLEGLADDADALATRLE
ncbi:MAG: hypothetical protein ABEJ92_08390 [Halobacteriales archaeon]